MRTLVTIVAILFSAAPQPCFGSRVVTVDIEGIVHPVTADIVGAAIRQAQQKHADAVLIRINTPGGLLDATRSIVEEVFHSPVPVIMWVGPSGARAASAGFFLLECGDIASMAPGTNTGASHPVALGGGQMDPVMKEKAENDAAALMRAITTHRGRNQDAAEKAVRQSVSYTDREALDLHLIDLIASSPALLLKQLDGREITRFDGQRETLHFAQAQITPYPLSLRQRVLRGIADPNIALLLLVLGAVCIYAEFSNPGMVAPGVIGSILVLLGLTALAMFPIDWLGAALMILALVFFALEAKFVTHGVLTLGGAAAMTLGAILLIDTTLPELRIRWTTALAVSVPFALITTFLLSIAVRARRNKVVTGVEGMIGQIGSTVAELNPAGTILIRGEYWNARADSRIPPSRPVRVTGVDGLTLRVEQTEREDS
ncbi:MAG TPA: nodulation protein NfeD [Bryobacteraceae bacterium]|nr:nodulation protein NfeD [Bryobacteraceae bacterium]